MEINKIYNVDCIEYMKTLPDASVDMIITDPPYGINFNDGDLSARKNNVFGCKQRSVPRAIMNDGNKEALQLFTQYTKEANRILKAGAFYCVCVCGGGGAQPLFARWSLIIDKLMGFNHAVVWDKGGLGMGIQWRRSYEFILIGRKKGQSSHRWNGGKKECNILREGRFNKIIPNKDQHPTEKPVKLFRYFINLYSNKGDLVFDGFLGSGATAVACVKANRNFIGCELDKQYYDIAQKRIKLEQDKKETELFKE